MSLLLRTKLFELDLYLRLKNKKEHEKVCDAWPVRRQTYIRPRTIIFPAAGHHRPLTSTKLYCMVTEAQLAQNS